MLLEFIKVFYIILTFTYLLKMLLSTRAGCVRRELLIVRKPCELQGLEKLAVGSLYEEFDICLVLVCFWFFFIIFIYSLVLHPAAKNWFQNISGLL